MISLRCGVHAVMKPTEGDKCLFVGDSVTAREETCPYSDSVTSVSLRYKTRKLTTTPTPSRENLWGCFKTRRKTWFFSSTFFSPGPCLHTPGIESVSGEGAVGDRRRAGTQGSHFTSQALAAKSKQGRHPKKILKCT